VAGVRQILKYQWKAYWRRFTRPGQLAQFDILLLLLLGALLIFKLPPVLRRAARELAIGQTVVMGQLLFALAAAWLYPRIENAIISIHPKDLIRFPLTTNSMLLVRIGSFFISPAAMIILELCCSPAAERRGGGWRQSFSSRQYASLPAPLLRRTTGRLCFH
jgi:hypothetical protein